MLTPCRTCGKENEPHYRFCLGCGANLPTPGNDALPVGNATARETPAEGAMTRCASCGKHNTAHYKFCLGCGAALSAGSGSFELPSRSATLTCYNCGASNNGDLATCPTCGSPLANAPVAQGKQKTIAVMVGFAVVVLIAVVGLLIAVR